MKKYLTLKPAAIQTRAEMENLVREIATLKLDEKMLSARLDAEIQTVRAHYGVRLSALAQALTQKLETARDWAESNPAEFGRRKSIEFAQGVAGFRTGTPKLKTVSRRTWDSVLNTLRKTHFGGAYIRVKEEINKEQIIADVSAGVLNTTDLRNAGAKVARDETFYVEPKLTRHMAREIAEAA